MNIHFPSEKLILLDISSPRGVTTLGCEFHRQAGLATLTQDPCLSSGSPGVLLVKLLSPYPAPSNNMGISASGLTSSSWSWTTWVERVSPCCYHRVFLLLSAMQCNALHCYIYGWHCPGRIFFQKFSLFSTAVFEHFLHCASCFNWFLWSNMFGGVGTNNLYQPYQLFI